MTAPTLTPIPGRRTRTRRTAPPTIAVGYLRVSTTEQADSRLGLDAQRAAIEQQADALGLTVVHYFTDAGVSGTIAPSQRLGMAAALAALDAGDAGVLMAAKIDRLGRNTRDTLDIADRAARGGWRIVTDSYDSGESSPAATLQLSMFAAFAQWERDLISSRTREALAELKARGVQLGQPTTLPDAVIRRILTELSERRSLRQIAAGLEADGIPTATGRAKWHPQTVKNAADSQRARAIAADLFTD